ncbi:SyrB-like regulator [Ensifer canadensis]
MGDENNTVVTETAPAAEVAPPKKRRGPRPKSVVLDATAETPEADAAQPARGRRKGANKSVDDGKASAKPSRAKNVAKSTGKARATKQRVETPAPDPVLDDIADLLQLEEENVRLRKALSQKLRAENADLRKRLGIA